MLNKRTNFLLKKETWDSLKSISKDKNTSIGDLIRRAIEEVYFKENINEVKRKAIENTIKVRRVIPNIAKYSYKDLINEGRKY